MALTAAMLAFAAAAPASAAPQPGERCKKAGKVSSTGLICTRKRGKLVWTVPRTSATPNGGAPVNETPSGGTSTGGGETPTSPEFTAAEKETIKKAFEQTLPGKQVDRTFTSNGNLTQLIWHFCPSNRYGLISNLTFSGSGSTTSTEIGTWRVVEAGGIRGQAEGVLIAMTPDDPSVSPYSVELIAFTDGRVQANGRSAVVTPSQEC